MSGPLRYGNRQTYSFLAFFILLFLFSPFYAEVHAGSFADRDILPNGLVLLHAEKKTIPIIKVVVAIKAGSVSEPAEKAGLANLTADLLDEGTARRSSKRISDDIEFIGGSLSTSGGADYITVTLSILNKDAELGFDLLSDVILNPSFSEEELIRRKAVIRSSIIQQREEPGTVASKAFLKAIFGDHPYGWPLEGTEDTLERINRQDVLDFHRTHYLPNNSIMSVVGDISRADLTSLISRHFGDWKAKEIQEKPLPALSQGKGPGVIKINREITQANIILGNLGITRDNPDYYAVTVMNYILGGGGFSSRLMDNIRDNRGLAYSVYSMFSANKFSGWFQAGLQTKNLSANTAIEEILREMERIIEEPVTEKELADAKSYLTGSFPLRIDSNSKIAGFLIAIEYYNLGLDYHENYGKLINAVTREDIMRVARKYLSTKDYVLVVVGNLEKASLKY